MSIMGISPTDIAIGFRTAKTIIDAVREQDGSKERFTTAVSSIEQHLEAVKDYEHIVKATSDEVSTSKPKMQHRLASLLRSQEGRKPN